MQKFSGSCHNLAALRDEADGLSDYLLSGSRLEKMSRGSLDEGSRSKRMIMVANHLPLRALDDGKGGHEFEWDEDSLIGQAKEGIDSTLDVIYVGGLPVAIPQDAQDRLSDELLAKFRCYPVFLEPELKQKFYQGFCKQQLWPLLHYVLPMSPLSLGRFDPELWQAYVRANMIFTDRLVEVVSQDVDYVWIHDYHLMVLPSLLRRRLHKVACGLFLHSAFPSSEIFRAFPKREELLRSMLNADVIGFHTFDYARHFLSCCSRMLGLEHHTKRGSILMTYYGRDVHLKILPTGVQPERFIGGFQWAETKWRIGELKDQLKGKTVLLGVDDMDMFKGIEMKLLAFERLLDLHEEWRGSLVLVQITNAPRSNSKETQDLLYFIKSTADRINQKYGDARVGFSPLIYIERPVPLHERLAYYSLADVVVVTATRDGMNLVPYEYIVCRQGAPELVDRTSMLVVSEFVGCSPSLSGALRVNPWSTSSVSDGIYKAIKMPKADQRMRHEKHWSYVQKHTVSYWASSCTQYLIKSTEGHQRMKTYGLGLGLDNFRVVALDPSFQKLQLATLLPAYQNAKKRLILCDYDGTLVPSTQMDMRPSSEVMRLLNSLAEDPNNSMYIVSGRVKADLQAWFSGMLSLGVASEHGYYKKHPGNAEWRVEYPGLDFSWKEIVRPIMEVYTMSTDGTHIVEKDSGITWAYANADPDFGSWQAKELLDHLESVMVGEAIEVVSGQHYVEVKPKGMTKGVTVRKLLETVQPDFVLCMGDDRSDEEMFQTFTDASCDSLAVFACTVGQKPSNANYYVNDHNDVVSILSRLSENAGA